MKRVLFFILLMAALIFAGCAEKKEEVVAVVNGEEITGEQFRSYYNMLKNSYELEAGKIDEHKDKNLLKNIEDKAYDDLVLQVLIRQQAEKEGIKIDDRELEADLQAFKEHMGEKGYKDFLKRTGMTEKELLRQLKIEKMYKELKERVTSDVKVSDEEVKKYYEENEDLFKEPGGIRIYHILVDSEEEARSIIARLNKGEDFSRLAQKYSKCPSREKGGDLGIVNESTNFVTPFKEAALKLKPGEITQEPVKTEFGYHVIKAGEKVAGGIKKLEEVKEELRYQLEEEARNKVFSNYIENLQRNADIIDKRK
ncbi:peptidyl-prolyl cis-trans isomerase C [Thermosyntropha lipolytica DSM 11003]|uniref:Peptidyl-prolyl cis-trans isomerase C n=1 Tax=Thermosyntropha lipolytica DSM 11003 TaxID=1123382 RepID=A0A1M5NDP5_9FIRM|nr:peptidyl-prolyl cis-trans isomerase [Thermosyntropha lipolytica]SHG87587.1 peptidyl-prolyl cis-trans isomerase C [Thermosyntropha lipolytica DSM 11003]